MLRSMLTGACLLALLAACATSPQKTANATGSACVDHQDAWAKSGSCAVSGRTWTREDMERTGEQNVGPALQKLDPAITEHH